MPFMRSQWERSRMVRVLRPSYTGGMTHKVGPKGQVVIPKEMRDELGLRPGDEVDFELSESGVLVEPVRRRLPLKGTLSGHRLVEALEQDRLAEPR